MILRGDQLEVGMRVKAAKNLFYLRVKGHPRRSVQFRDYYRHQIYIKRYGTVCNCQLDPNDVESLSICWDGRQGYSTVGGTQTRYKVITP